MRPQILSTNAIRNRGLFLYRNNSVTMTLPDFRAIDSLVTFLYSERVGGDCPSVWALLEKGKPAARRRRKATGLL
jgi:hypothetical protein